MICTRLHSCLKFLPFGQDDKLRLAIEADDIIKGTDVLLNSGRFYTCRISHINSPQLQKPDSLP